MRFLRALGVCAVTAAASMAWIGVEAPVAGAWTEGPCPTASGVTVVVDFQQLGGGVKVRCATGGADTGFQALDRSGFSWTPTVRFPGFLCRIDGVPADDPCQTTPPTTRYWSYWNATRGGTWCYGNFGAGNRTPPAGTVEGWSMSLDRGTSSAPEPRVAPPAWVPGAPRTMPDSTCSQGPAPTTTPTPPPTTAPGPTAGSGGRGGAPTGNQASTTPSGATVGGLGLDRSVTGPSVPAEPGTGVAAIPGDTAPPTASDPSESVAPAESEHTSSESATTTSHATSGGSGSEVAADRGGSLQPGGTSAGSPLGVIAALVLVGAITATSAVVRRRATTPAE